MTGTPCEWKVRYELMKQIRDASTAYCLFTESAGAGLGTFADAMVNKSIALLVKLRESRDYTEEYLHHEIRTDEQEIELAESILNGTYQEDRIHSVIRRIYC